MGKKEKRKGKAQQPTDDSSQRDRERQRRGPQQVYQVPQRREQQASSHEEPSRREQPTRHEEVPRREQPSSRHEDPSRGEQPPSQHEDSSKREQQQAPSRHEEPHRGERQQPHHHEKSSMEEQPEPSTSGNAKGFGRGRGKGKRDLSNQDLPKVGANAGTFFGKEVPTAKSGDIHPELLAPTAENLEPSKDVPRKKKIQYKPEEEVLLSKVAGISLETTSPVKFNMAKRPNYGTLGKRIGLYVNYFRLQYKNTSIYHYDIDISEATKDKKMGESLMSKGRTAKQDIEKKVKHIERQKRRNIGKAKCRQIISEMIKSKSLQKFHPIYDGQKNLFTSEPLPYKEKLSFPIDVLIDERVKQFYITIQPVRKKDGSNCIDLQPLIDLYAKRSTEIPLEVLLVYETVMNHRDPPFNQVQFRNSFFSLNRENVNNLGSGLEIWFGYNQSIHLTELGPVVVINLAAKAFHKAGPVIQYASDIVGCDISRLPKLENWHLNDLNNCLKGIQVKVTHQRHPRKYKIKGLTKLAAKELMFDDGNRKKSVSQYFQEKYNVRLSYPHLPCLQMQTSNNTTYIPIETCVIVEGQPKIGKLSGDLTSKMIRSTAIPPEQRFKSISNDAKKIKNTSKTFMDAFGLIMDINLLKVDGRLITAPQLKYESKNATPDNRGVWRIEDGKKFYRVVKVDKWVLISFADERRFGMDVLSRYCQFLVQSANKCGMQMNRPTAINLYGRNDSTEKAIRDAKTSGVDFAIVVLNRRDAKHTYDEVKFLSDFKYRLVTQCMEDKTLTRINDQITTNVCLKINVKLGGINHVLMQNPQIFSKPVMVIGADAIHWTRGLGFPSIVSVVASLNPSASRYALTCHPQRNLRTGKISQEIIRNMEDIAKELLEIFQLKNNGLFPQKIVVFRDGVSEGQFQHAIDHEVYGIQQACLALSKPVVPITFIVVQKRHQTRFYPQDPAQSAGKCRNIPPGTVVDKDISHPTFFDFFVCSHEGIQGTSKPAHYTVLHDDNKFKADELQQLCHFLCHTYVRCTRSVSLPAPVLYADLAAFRAKKYADLFINPDDVSTSSSGEDVEREFPEKVLEAIKSMKSFENNMFYV